MVARRRQEGEGWERKTRKLTDPLGRSDSGGDNSASDVPLRYLRRDSNNNDPLSPHRSSGNTPALTDSYQF